MPGLGLREGRAALSAAAAEAPVTRCFVPPCAGQAAQGAAGGQRGACGLAAAAAAFAAAGAGAPRLRMSGGTQLLREDGEAHS